MTLKSSPSSRKDGMHGHATRSPFSQFPLNPWLALLGNSHSQLRQVGGKNLLMTLPSEGQKLISSRQVGSWIPPRPGGSPR